MLSRLMNTDVDVIGRLASTYEPIILSREERARHVFIVGKSGSGKSTMLFNLAVADLLSGEGFAYVDPHGDNAAELVDGIPASRTHEVCYINVADTECPVGFNPLAGVSPQSRAIAMAGIVGSFRDLFGDSWGYRSEQYLSAAVATLLELEHPTLLDAPLLFTDDAFRDWAIARVTDRMTRRFWENEYLTAERRFRSEAAAPILNKLSLFAASPNVRMIIGQTQPKFDLRYAMNNSRAVILNLAKGVIGEQAANVLGSLFVSHLTMLTFERSQVAPKDRAPFSLHIDELQTIKTDAVASLMSEARKFGIQVSVATQFCDQLSDKVRAAIFGNAGTLVVYRVSGADAHALAPEFHPVQPSGLTSNAPFVAWLRRNRYEPRLIQCEPPFQLRSGRFETVVAQSRRHFGRSGEALQL